LHNVPARAFTFKFFLKVRYTDRKPWHSIDNCQSRGSAVGKTGFFPQGLFHKPFITLFPKLLTTEVHQDVSGFNCTFALVFIRKGLFYKPFITLFPKLLPREVHQDVSGFYCTFALVFILKGLFLQAIYNSVSKAPSQRGPSRCLRLLLYFCLSFYPKRPFFTSHLLLCFPKLLTREVHQDVSGFYCTFVLVFTLKGLFLQAIYYSVSTAPSQRVPSRCIRLRLYFCLSYYPKENMLEDAHAFLLSSSMAIPDTSLSIS
jgi:hypothetical protein